MVRDEGDLRIVLLLEEVRQCDRAAASDYGDPIELLEVGAYAIHRYGVAVSHLWIVVHGVESVDVLKPSAVEVLEDLSVDLIQVLDVVKLSRAGSKHL